MISLGNSSILINSKTLSRYEQAILSHYVGSGHEIYRNKADEIIDTVLHEPSVRYLAQQRELFRKSAPFSGSDRRSDSFTFIDLFAGIGGFRLAMQQHGGLCVFSSEWDKSAQETYYNNYGEVPFGDITKAEVKTFIPEHFDVLCAGFPCQPFSLAGVSARSSLGLEHGFDHPTQGNLFFEIIDIVKRHEPKVLFLENVKNLKSHNKGDTFKIIKNMIMELGYSFNSTVINAQTEVPQRRERTYMVCFKSGSDFTFPNFDGDPLPLKAILEPNVGAKYTISDKLWQGHQRRTEKNLSRGTGFTAFCANLNKPSNTLVARYGKDGKECLIPQEGKNPRKLTPRECARLQGFPEDFILPSSDAAAYKQFGNSVAVPVIKKIAKKVINQLLDEKQADLNNGLRNIS